MDEYDDESNYICPFCKANCGPDYSDYTDHVYDEHPVSAGPRDTASLPKRKD